MREPSTVKSLARALTILDALVFDAPDDGLPLAELARHVGMPRNTCHKVLQTFVAAGYVRTDGTGRYAIGPRCVEIGRRAVLATAAVRRTVDAHLRALAADLGEGVIYTVLVDGQRRPLGRAEPNRAVRVDSGVLDRHGIYALPTGRVLLAYASPAEVERIAARPGPPPAPRARLASPRPRDPPGAAGSSAVGPPSPPPSRAPGPSPARVRSGRAKSGLMRRSPARGARVPPSTR